MTAVPICDEVRQRIIFMGQELQNAQVSTACNYVHAHLYLVFLEIRSTEYNLIVVIFVG